MASHCSIDAHLSSLTDSNFSLWHLSNVTAMAGNMSAGEILTAAQTAAISTLKRQYLNNDYFAGGMGLMLIGLLGRFLSTNVSLLWSLFSRRRGLYSLAVKPDDSSFVWLQEWLSKNVSKDVTQLTLVSKWDHNDWDESSESGSAAPASDRPRLMFIPQLVKAQSVKYKDQTIMFQLKKEFGPANRNDGDGEDLASILQSANSVQQLVLDGPSREILEEIVKEAMNDALEVDEKNRRTNIMRWNVKDFYWHAESKLVRPLDSIVLDCDVDFLIKDAKQFMTSNKWYCDRGIPHRRGYIFHGPPGCGKTSLIQAMAGELRLDVSMVSLSNKGMDDDMLLTAMSRASAKSLLVLEDVDAVFNQRKDGEEKASSLSFSGLLNAIDGMAAQEGHILIMTTNHIEKLDAALIRPGRVDLRLYLGLASRDQIASMFLRFYPESTQEVAEKFSSMCPDEALSPAMVQGYFLMHRDDATSAIEHVEDLMEQLRQERERVSGANSPQLRDVSLEALNQLPSELEKMA